MTDSSEPYNRRLQEFAARFEGITFEETHAAAIDLIKEPPGTALDIGAGIGRDAAWFAGRGWDVVAVEPAAEMRAYGELLHRHPRLRWLDDRPCHPSLLARPEEVGDRGHLLWRERGPAWPVGSR